VKKSCVGSDARNRRMKTIPFNVCHRQDEPMPVYVKKPSELSAVFRPGLSSFKETLNAASTHAAISSRCSHAGSRHAFPTTPIEPSLGISVIAILIRTSQESPIHNSLLNAWLDRSKQAVSSTPPLYIAYHALHRSYKSGYLSRRSCSF